jgi:uncharacterized protein YndB with AHSA1/START domain
MSRLGAAPRAYVTLTREFAAPPELMFRLWIEPRHLAAWWGPTSFDNPICEVDARVGGALLIHMRAPDGMVYPMAGAFTEVEPPSRLAFTSKALSAAGEVLLESSATVTFEATTSGGTRLTVTADAVGVAPQAPPMLAGMEEGWRQTLNNLADVAAQQSEAK